FLFYDERISRIDCRLLIKQAAGPPSPSCRLAYETSRFHLNHIDETIIEIFGNTYFISYHHFILGHKIRVGDPRSTFPTWSEESNPQEMEFMEQMLDRIPPVALFLDEDEKPYRAARG
ncbi:hypothetical protein EJB05_40619, partial [Eragrostis curvula]